MKYTFVKDNGIEKTVEIADEWLSKTKRALGISTHEAIQMWLCDNDYITNEEQEQLNMRAGNAGAGLRVQSKERKKPTRKPDDVKRELIRLLSDLLNDVEEPQIENVNVINVERIISFSIGEDQYELTLSKKRKPKA